MYTIKTVTSLTGISNETLRAWERRYGTVVPNRDSKGRRLYTQDDVERLTLLANAIKQGFAISKITELSKVELQDLLAANETPESSEEQDRFFNQVIEALENYQMNHCEHLLKRALIAMDPLNYVCDLLMPLLHKIGELWRTGIITIVQEHMFSACVERIIHSLVNHMQPFSGAENRILFATPSGEKHEFGILFSYLLAAHQNFSCFYIGPDVPWADMLSTIDKLNPVAVVLGLVNTPIEPSTLECIEKLAELSPDSVQLCIGGVAAKMLLDQNQLSDRYLFTTSLVDFNDKLNWLNQS